MTELPTGTIAFLFTDIEGSTTLWESHPEQMSAAIAKHDLLLRRIVDHHGGCVFKTTGDGVNSAFHTAPDAVNAALDIQLALLVVAWPPPITLSIRMGIHTGSAELRDGDYFGPTTNRVVRLMAAGHGGQTLLSEATHELCRDVLPPETVLRSLGQQRLKDLTRPETIYQLSHPALKVTFPPLRTLDNPAHPNNLPQQLTSFVGREAAIKDVRDYLMRARLLTLAGSGGSGKTRLALQVAAESLEDYGDGCWLAEFAALSDPSLVPQTVASALGVREKPGQSVLESLLENLKEKRLLLLLDNAEHLLMASAGFVSSILRGCPGVTILVTSREALGITGEQVYRVPSLSLPTAKEADAATAISLSQFEAVRLFIDRALLIRADFAVTNANAPAVAQLCFRLDGIPLAIELAAARVRSLAVEDINNRLDQRFRLLTGGDRSALPRQQTLRALVDWSYDLLTDAEKALLQRLSVFAGGWTIESAEAVCGFAPIEDWEVLNLLTSLADKSLVVVEAAEGAHRYRMLETLRQYAIEKGANAGAGEIEEVRSRHRDFFVEWVASLEPRLAGPDQLALLNRLEDEHDNLRSALAWAASGPDGETAGALIGLRLAGILARFWWLRGYVSEGRGHVDLALARAEAVALAADATPEDAREFALAKARALNASGSLAWSQGEYAIARSQNEAGLEIQRACGDNIGIARSLLNLGNVAHRQSNLVDAHSLFAESLKLSREIDDKFGIASALNGLGNVTWAQGDLPGAWDIYQETLGLQRTAGNIGGVASTLNNLGIVAALQHDFAAARSLFEESVTLQRTLGNKAFIANSLQNLGQFVASQGDIARGRVLIEEGLALRRELGDRLGIAQCLAGLGSIALGESAPARAVTLWGAANALREVIKAPLAPADQAEHDIEYADARAQIGEIAYAVAWAEGRALTVDDAGARAVGAEGA